MICVHGEGGGIDRKIWKAGMIGGKICRQWLTMLLSDMLNRMFEIRYAGKEQYEYRTQFQGTGTQTF